MKRRFAIAVLVCAAAVAMTGCPYDAGYGFQHGLWHFSFANSPAVYGIHFFGSGDPIGAQSVDVGFGTLPGNFSYQVKNNVFTMEQVVDSNTRYVYSASMLSHYEMSGDWQLEGAPYIGQFSAIHSDPLPLEEEE